MAVVIVAAVAANGVIGADGGMPWHLPADLRQFRERTTGHPVVVGRRTFASIRDRLGGPLPDRTNVVLTRGDRQFEGALVAHSPAEALAVAREAPGGDTVYVAGGASVYEAFLDRADRLVLSELHDSHEGDTVFPDVDWSAWRETARDPHDAFDVVTYERADAD